MGCPMTTRTKSEHETASAREPRLHGYRRKLLAVRLLMLWEGLWRRLWPAVSLLSVFCALVLFGLPPLLPGWLHALALAALVAATAVLMWRGLRGLAVPRHADARRRLEQASGFAHRPLQTLDDRMAEGIGDIRSERLWQEHRARMLAAARTMRIGLPHPGVAARDPLALRFAVALIVVIAAVVGWSDAGDRFRAAVTPDLSLAAMKDVPRLELWITPPAYTGLPPIFPETAVRAEPPPPDDAPPPAISVPAGSTLTVRLYGDLGDAALIRGRDRTPLKRVDSRNAALSETVETSGRRAVALDGDILAEWWIELVPDAGPAIALANPPTTTERKALRIDYAAGDDYGLERIGAEIRRSYERGTVIGKEVERLDLALPEPGAKTLKETGYFDLTAHRWAGLPVVIRLKAADGIGQTAFSEDAGLVLPERVFRHPVARAVIEQRKRLTTEPERHREIARRLLEIAFQPGDYQERTVTFLALSAAGSRLIHSDPEAAIPPVIDLLWETALGIEDGGLSIAERALRRARRALAEALSRAASDEELERLMNRLQQALDEFVRELARRLGDQREAMPFDPSMQTLEATDLQRMMEQIRNLLRAGAREAARQMLAQLQNILENLRAGRPMQANPQAQAAGQALQDLQRLIQRQTELMDRSFRQSQTQGSEPRPQDSRRGATIQRELQAMLERLRQALRRMGMRADRPDGPDRAFEEADRNMDGSARALDRNAPGDSVPPQGRAIEALQRAGRGMVQQMINQMGRGMGIGLGQPFHPMQQRRDPLGRYTPDLRGMDTRDLMIPDERAVERAQRILDELRRRAGQHQRPRLELDYIDRLLRRF